MIRFEVYSSYLERQLILSRQTHRICVRVASAYLNTSETPVQGNAVLLKRNFGVPWSLLKSSVKVSAKIV
jgi:hypothetical protein